MEYFNGKPKKKPKPKQPAPISKEQGAMTGTNFKSAAANRGAAMQELTGNKPPANPLRALRKKK